MQCANDCNDIYKGELIGSGEHAYITLKSCSLYSADEPIKKPMFDELANCDEKRPRLDSHYVLDNVGITLTLR